MVGAVVGFGGFEAVNVKRFFYDEDGGFVARGVGVEGREVFAGVDEGEGLGARFDAGVESTEPEAARGAGLSLVARTLSA